jgi:hypothetical protein
MEVLMKIYQGPVTKKSKMHSRCFGILGAIWKLSVDLGYVFLS